jgi:hypothetical protein
MKRLTHWIILLALLGLSAVVISFLPASLAPLADKSLVAGATAEREVLDGLKKLSPKQLQDLTARELESFKSNPLDKLALQNLAVLAELQGDSAKSEKLALVLSDYGRRSVAAQLAAVQINIAAKDFKNAFDRMDGVLRASPELSDKLFPLMTSQLADKSAQTAMGEILARDPPWRDTLLKNAAEQDGQASLAYAILTAIRGAKAEIKDSEKRLVIEKLIKASQFDSAYFIWLDLLPPAELALVRNVFDGGFDTLPRQLFFDWNVPPRKNARIEVATRPGSAQDRAIALDFFADFQGKEFVYQFLRLSPGIYDMTFEVLADGLKSDSGVVWRISCLGNPENIGESQPVVASGPWTKSQFALTVPETACATQLLRLESRGRAKLDKEISGRLMFDNIVISKPGENPAAPEAAQP